MGAANRSVLEERFQREISSILQSLGEINIARCIRGLPFSTYAPRGMGGVKPPIHFHCVLHAKWGWVGPDIM